MSGGFQDGNLFETAMLLRCEVKAQKQIIEEFKSGQRYLKLQEDYKRVTNGYIREIKKLKKELADAHAQTVSVRELWSDTCDQVWQEYRTEMARKNEKIRQLEDRNWELQQEMEEKAKSYEAGLEEKERIIRGLKERLTHMEALLGRDSTNTSMPTGQTPPGKKKHIPNSRRRSGKKRGGQPGHEKHTMGKPSEEEVTEEIEHVPSRQCCPACGSKDLSCTGKCEERFEVDIEIVVKKKRHKFWQYICNDCGETVMSETGSGLRAECRYGPVVQGVALSLMNTTNAAINKVQLFLSGMTGGEVCPSEGYIAKLMKKAAGGLAGFMGDLFGVVTSRPVLYWDDTVVTAGKKRICLRFYGDEKVAYYVAHDKKDMDSVIEDGVLDALAEGTAVMHDHNRINYNDRFAFTNVECNAHLQRDLQKIVDETGHNSFRKLKELISATIKERNDLVQEGKAGFEGSYIEDFERRLTEAVTEAEKEAEGNTSVYSGPFEQAVIRRVKEYRGNYFAWVRDFTIPTTNNLSERALRGVKTKMKVSGQFLSTQNANNYAMVKSYIETCRRNGINEISALTRLCAGNPMTVAEIFSEG